MNTNEIRFHLHSYDKLKDEIQALSDSLKEYRLMDGMKPKVITDMPICHSGTSTVESLVVNRVDYVADLENKIDGKMRIVNAINSVYFYLKEPARTIIEMRYFISPMINDVRKPKYSWASISIEVDLNEEYCKQIDCKVIRKIQTKLLEGGK